MGSANISKIERVHAPRSPDIWVDLCLNKQKGTFFARVGQETIEESTKAEAVRKTQEALARLTTIEWKPVIIIRTTDRGPRDDHFDGGTENNMPNYSASCSFDYLRRERAVNPLKPKERIERMHSIDFEEVIKKRRADAGYFERTPADKKRRADEVEAELRHGRAASEFVHNVYNWATRESHFSGARDRKLHEYELPYTEEAWAGVLRIAQTLRETQKKLDAFAAEATPKVLAALGAGKGPLMLLPKGDK